MLQNRLLTKKENRRRGFLQDSEYLARYKLTRRFHLPHSLRVGERYVLLLHGIQLQTHRAWFQHPC